jgi:hypothetical protein
MRMDSKVLVTSLLISFALLITGCSVVKGGAGATKDAYLELGRWKDDAKKNMTKPNYAEVQREVNVWIEAKAKEVELVAADYFGEVDLSRPAELRSKVQTITGTKESDFKDIIEWLIGKNMERRSTEGAKVSAGLRDYVWPDKTK